MESGGGSEGDGQEERRGTPSRDEDERDGEEPGAPPAEVAGDPGDTAPPGREAGSGERSDSEPPGVSPSRPGDSDVTVTPPRNSEQDSHATPLQPHPSLQPPTPLSDGGGEEERRGAEEEEDEEEEEGGEAELTVLDPEHPLMKRFQSALKNHLNKQLERLDQELREKTVLQKAESRHMEELGVEQYSVQQELARLQACLEGRHQAGAQARARRRQAQEQLEAVRGQYRAAAGQAGQQRSHVSQLQAKVDGLALHLFYTREVNADLRSDIAAMRNATRKAHADKARSEGRKREQDLYVERLAAHAERLAEQMALYDAQAAAQSEETRAAREALSEAQMEMDSLAMERKQLLQQWDSSVVAMRRRDEAFTAMQDALRAANHQVRSLDTETEGFKRSATREEERNELLTRLLNRAQLEAATSRKLIGQSQTQQEALQAKYGAYGRMLQESEQTLARLDTDCGVRQAEASSLRKQAERESAARAELEDAIVAKMQEQLTHDNAAKYSRRLTDKMAARKREREAELTQVENGLAQAALDGSEAELRAEALSRQLTALDREAARCNGLLSAGEAEAARRVTVIERKQAAINVLNKKIERAAASTGHEDLGPLEIQAATLAKQLEEAAVAMAKQQQLWLWQQGELVRLTRGRQAQSAALVALETQLTILQQRKLRTEGDIEQEHREQAELERRMKTLTADMLKLNGLLSQNSALRQALEQDNALMETHFLHRLKDAERESMEMQMKLDRIQEEKERLLNSLVEAERQIMLWERKTQLVKETRLAVDSEVGQGDIRTMKAEIHRMEVRYAQLMRQQERALRDMEEAVSRRESAAARAEAPGRQDRRRPPPTHAHLHAALHGLRRNIQDLHKQADECDGVLRALRESQVGASGSLTGKQLRLEELRGAALALAATLHSLQDHKDRNLARLVSLQSRAKQLQALRDGRHPPALGAPEALGPALQRHDDRLHAVAAVLQRVAQELPQHQGALRRLLLRMDARPATPPGGR